MSADYECCANKTHTKEFGCIPPSQLEVEVTAAGICLDLLFRHLGSSRLDCCSIQATDSVASFDTIPPRAQDALLVTSFFCL